MTNSDAQSNLLALVKRELRKVAQFLAILFLGLLAALLMALPWLLRMACVLVWLAGAYIAITTIDDLYSPFSPSGPLVALQFVIVFMAVAWAGLLVRKQTKHIWAGLALGGLLPIATVWLGIPWLAEWQYAGLLVRVLPPALLSLLLIYTTLRMRFLRSRQQFNLAGPAFTWLPGLFSKFTGEKRNE